MIGLLVIHLVNKHLLRAYYVTETVGSTGENEMTKTETRPREPRIREMAQPSKSIMSKLSTVTYNHRVLKGIH